MLAHTHYVIERCTAGRSISSGLKKWTSPQTACQFRPPPRKSARAHKEQGAHVPEHHAWRSLLHNVCYPWYTLFFVHLLLVAHAASYTSREVSKARRPHTCSRRSKKKNEKRKRNPAAPKALHEIHSSPATATTSRRRATKHDLRVSPYSLASIDAGFVEIGLVQLSQSVETTNVTRTQYTDLSLIHI